MVPLPDAWRTDQRPLEGDLLWNHPSIFSVLSRCSRWLEHQQKLRRCSQQLFHAELFLLASNAGGHQTDRRLEGRDITAIGQLHDGIGKLALRHSSVPDCFNTALAAIDPSLEACLKGMARFQECDDACTAEQATTQPNSIIRSEIGT